jgi:hypothetical protein
MARPAPVRPAALVVVPIAEIDPWNVKGRYGWVGGSGTAAHVVRLQDMVTILLT